MLNFLNSRTVSDALNSIMLDKTCFCNIIIHFEYIKKKRFCDIKRATISFYGGVGVEGSGGGGMGGGVERLKKKLTRIWLR